MTSFPLRIWEQTTAARDEFESMKSRFEKLRSRHALGSLDVGHITLGPSGNVEVVIVNRSREKPKTASRALELAQTTGVTGWYTVADLEQFARGEGKIIEHAMHGYGFRRHATREDHWVKRDKNAPAQVQDPPITESPEESMRLEALRVAKNAQLVIGSTYIARVNNRNLLHIGRYVGLAGGSYEQANHLLTLSRERFHIAAEQDGFTLEARTVYTPNQGNYLVATRTDGHRIEQLWPTVVAVDLLAPLARNFVDRVNNS